MECSQSDGLTNTGLLIGRFCHSHALTPTLYDPPLYMWLALCRDLQKCFSRQKNIPFLNNDQYFLNYIAIPELDISVNLTIVTVPSTNVKTMFTYPRIMHSNRRPHQDQCSEKGDAQMLYDNSLKPCKFDSGKIHIEAQWSRQCPIRKSSLQTVAAVMSTSRASFVSAPYCFVLWNSLT